MSEKIIQDILNKFQKKAILSGKQQDYISQFVNQDINMTYQEIAKDLASKINANERDIYDFLMTRDKQIYNDINLNKIQ